MEERPQEESAEREEKSEEESPEVEGHIANRSKSEDIEGDRIANRNKGVEGKDDVVL